eukprot:m.25929 g.25929  ORF g.25929 m.25929 type:complete len:607 (-) comp4278_c1_seq1:20-1840(-)
MPGAVLANDLFHPTPGSPNEGHSASNYIAKRLRLLSRQKTLLRNVDDDTTQHGDNTKTPNAACWTDESALLDAAAARGMGLTSSVVADVLHSLNLTDLKLSKLGTTLSLLTHCTELTLTGNDLASLSGDGLPPRLEVLHAGTNRIDTNGLATLSKSAPSTLLHVGLPLNKLDSLASIRFKPLQWRALLSLDVSHNWLCDLRTTASTLAQLPSLAALQTTGNPITLLPQYRPFMVNALPHIEFLDDHRVEFEERLESGLLSGCLPEKDAHMTVTIHSVSGLLKPDEYTQPPTTADGELITPPPPRRAYTYTVGLAVPGMQLVPPSDGTSTCTVPVESGVARIAIDGATTLDLEAGRDGDADGNTNTAASTTDAANTTSMKWSRVMNLPTETNTFSFRSTDLAELKRTCTSGITLGVYETMIESVLEDDTTTSNTLDIPGSAQSGSGRRSGRKSDQKGTGGKGKDKGSTSKRGSNKKGGGGAGVPVQDAARWVERVPVVRCVGHAVLRGVSRFLDNEACVDGKALIVDADGRSLPGYMPPNDPNPADDENGKGKGKKQAKKPVRGKSARGEADPNADTGTTALSAPLVADVPCIHVTVALRRQPIALS